MLRRILNLGIVAHVDAGKTTLTERLLYAAGVIDDVGSVDAGTTRTDSLTLERRRGITIRSAVVSFPVGDVSVNVIDTPGHPDFIAEVDRALRVLDGAVLVVSAVEGVQPQTRVLMRALRRLRVPTLMFVNKIDRAGAGYHRVLAAMSRRLATAVVPMGAVARLGNRDASFTPWAADDGQFRARLFEVLAERDEALLAAYVDDEPGVPYRRLREELARQSARGQVHPVFFGSAVTGAGIAPLMAGLAELLPAAAGDPDGPVSGRVFSIERGTAGEKVAYVRMFSGTVRTRDRLRLDRTRDEKVTAVSVFDGGDWVRRRHVGAGEIGKLWGLAGVRVGDAVGEPEPDGVPGTTTRRLEFPPPTMEAVVVPCRAGDASRLRTALLQLSEQDPLINLRSGDAGEVTVALYGEVQREILQQTLVEDYGIEVAFRESTIVCVERPARRGEAVEVLNTASNPFSATVGLRVDPAPAGSGIDVRLRVDASTIPLYVYRNVQGFAGMMGRYVRRALREGLYGWQVTDCVVSLVECGYSSADGSPSTRGPLSTAADFRKLTPLVLMRALERAGTVVCEPVVRASLEIPAEAVGAVLTALARVGAAVEASLPQADLFLVDAVVSAARIPELQRQLPELTGGEGVLETSLGGFRPVTGEPPARRRTTVDPRNRDEYLRHLAGHGPQE